MGKRKKYWKKLRDMWSEEGKWEKVSERKCMGRDMLNKSEDRWGKNGSREISNGKNVRFRISKREVRN